MEIVFLEVVMNKINLSDPATLANPPRKEHPFLMYDAITSIPSVISRCLEKDFVQIVERAADVILDRKIEDIYLVGCGTSYNSAKGMVIAFEQFSGIPTRVFDALEFLLYPPPVLNKNVLVIGLSHSGGSLPTKEAIDFANSKGCLSIGITGNENGDLIKLTNIGLVDPLNQEIPRPKTRSYFSAVFMGFSLASELGKKRLNYVAPDIKQLHFLLSNLINDCQEQIKFTISEWDSRITHYMLAGSGLNSATSFEVALKIMEAFGYPAVGFDLEEFTHGAGYCLNKGSAVILFDTSQRTLSRTLEASNGVKQTQAELMVITTHPQANWPNHAHIIPLPEFSEIWSDFLAIVPAQLLVYFSSLKKGQNPDLAMNDHTEIRNLSKTMFPPGTH